MHYGKILCSIGLGAIALLSLSVPAKSDDTSPIKFIDTECFTKLNTAPSNTLRSQRVELYYYRNATNIAAILQALNASIEGIGCPVALPVNSFTLPENLSEGKQPPNGGEGPGGRGVGTGGGNIILLYGNSKYIRNAHRLITTLDLPLPGISLQLWGVQLSSSDPDDLAETLADVRNKISVTQDLLRTTFAAVQAISQDVLKDSQRVDPAFKTIATGLRYAEAINGFGSESLIEVTLAGDAMKDDERQSFYQKLYDEALLPGTIKNGRFVTKDRNLQPYFDAYKTRVNRPPFERFFRSRGLKADCAVPENYDESSNDVCEQWKWIEARVDDLAPQKGFLAERITNSERKQILEFAHQYTDFVSHPDHFDPNELQSTSEALNTLLQRKSSLLQKDIEDFCVRPTLDDIQEIVDDNQKVSYAQVGRSTISTLNGVPTSLNTTSYSTGFENRQNNTFEDLLEAITTTLGITNPDIDSIGSLAIPQIINVIAELSKKEQENTLFSVRTGTNLTFTPGISRNLGAAEINIRLQITDPSISPTEQGNNVPSISRIGTQTLVTTVYTQALDFFDLSTFTSQASVDGGRYVVPIIGQVWNAIFDPIPILGNLFSFDRGNQTVLNESLLLQYSGQN
ncbi:hypothetical protein [Leptothoe kymatousa]|uniref:Uncharacterized protein n=1 Tax=Leptothoe kymatousa TAU-MAC 1615 TaxID=2364775 RepID=A0ABS5Y5V4_9CYAN|nr:hypothetical protein [Leptothoe kymatousa]MBT9313192.1 hypothetical protein [Leptothoe kymatousa TAU-MAC 1615]